MQLCSTAAVKGCTHSQQQENATPFLHASAAVSLKCAVYHCTTSNAFLSPSFTLTAVAALSRGYTDNPRPMASRHFSFAVRASICFIFEHNEDLRLHAGVQKKHTGAVCSDVLLYH